MDLLLLPTDLLPVCIVCPVTWRRQFGDEGIAALASLSALSRLDLMYRWVQCSRLLGAKALLPLGCF